MNNLNNQIQVDAVITWVDSGDEHWRNKINTYLEKPIKWNDKKDSIRYNSINEIEIAIKSIVINAPFIQNIYLVTDKQKPKNFEKIVDFALMHNTILHLTDHKEIFRGFESCLPTFNSKSIGAMLFRVPNLSEHFIVFNDDTFLMRKSTVEDFFIDGLPILRGRWDSFYEDKYLRTLYYKIKREDQKTKVGFKKSQQNTARILGFKKYFKRDHTPITLRKSVLEKYFEGNDKLYENVKYRFRNEKQFIVSSLANHLEIKGGNTFLTNKLCLTYFQSYKNIFITKLKLRSFDKNSEKRFMCFQNLELASPKQLKVIIEWISKRLNTKFDVG